MTKTYKERIDELIAQGKRGEQIFRALEEEGYRRQSDGQPFKKTDIYTVVSRRKRAAGLIAPEKMKKEKPKMIELTPLPKRGKILFIYGSFEDIEPIFERISNQ